MSNPDDLLLELLYEYKPHLQSYRHRMNTWNELLRVFNRKTGATYRQNRTLKTRFEKLKELFINGEDLPFTKVDLLEELLKEDRRDYRYAELRKSANSSGQAAGVIQVEQTETAPMPATDKKDADMDLSADQQSGMRSDTHSNTADPQPPPLDSITVFPHTQMRRFQERQDPNCDFGSASETSNRPTGSPYHNSQGSSDTNPPQLQFLLHKQQVSLMVESLKNEIRFDGSLEDEYKLRDVSTLEAIQEELSIIKKNQEEFQKSVMLKLDRIMDLMQQTSAEGQADFLNLPFAPHSHRNSGS